MSVSQIGTVLDSIRAGLVARAGLVSVGVFTGGVSEKEAEGYLELIEFGDADLSESPSRHGGTRQEEWSIEASLIGRASWQSDAETTIKAARDRALEMFAEVESYINDTYTGSLPDVDVTAGKMESGYGPEHRACRITFTLTITGEKNP